ncbi:PHD finger protein ALFIN-LIKE 4, partial [Bienertia sinuspersici]
TTTTNVGHDPKGTNTFAFPTVIKDFKGRRAAIIKALTKDFEEFYKLCDPNHPNLCLYGFPNQVWEVNLPGLSGELPEPRVASTLLAMSGHGMNGYVWYRFDKADRKRLSNKINDVPSIWEVVGGEAKKRVKIKGGGLPEEILDEEVLSRLPVRDLLKYRCWIHHQQPWEKQPWVSPPPYWSVGRQVYMKGAIHWINFGPKSTNDLLHLPEDSYVVLFDVKDEVFRYFELPFVMKSNFVPQEKFPTILNGSFAIFCAYDHEARHDIWVMNEYGVPESWSKCYTFTLQFDKLLHFKSNGELFYAINGKGIKSYDTNRKRVKDLAKTYSRYSKCRIYTYVESLVLLKEGKIQRP